MTIDRRKFLTRALSTGALTTVAGSKLALGAPPAAPAAKAADLSTWPGVRAEFLLSRDYIQMALMLLASHPRPVREAIERHRHGLDDDPVTYLEGELPKLEDAVRAAAADYTGGKPEEIALTGNTTTGLAMLYGGAAAAPAQEILTTTHDHYVDLQGAAPAARAHRRDGPQGAALRRPGEGVRGRDRRQLVKAIGPRTRAVACTWVHSSTA